MSTKYDPYIDLTATMRELWEIAQADAGDVATQEIRLLYVALGHFVLSNRLMFSDAQKSQIEKEILPHAKVYIDTKIRRAKYKKLPPEKQNIALAAMAKRYEELGYRFTTVGYRPSCRSIMYSIKNEFFPPPDAGLFSWIQTPEEQFNKLLLFIKRWEPTDGQTRATLNQFKLGATA